ncbi:DgyrCDS12016 [Dimorphilus gyrociliatus]|uniref:DgyrCDS12016 n=1 Tax=Dimorphilus gyrociliatus TaxID=2664684 RepID=A0A7I8W632_9ANNE|nr:DgyrCDS12016 [Dimorphilus gyrociliatus]
MNDSEVFRPTNGPLIVRGNLRQNLVDEAFKKQGMERLSRPGSQARFGNLSFNSFFARHNPHPSRVRHMPGLLDIPICTVNDDGYFASPRYKLSFPPNNFQQQKMKIPVNADRFQDPYKYTVDTISGLQHHLGGNLNMRVFREKAVPHVGLVPVTEAWRDELRALTDAAYNVAPKQNLPQIHQTGSGKASPARSTASRQKTPNTSKPQSHCSRPGTRVKTQYSTETGRIIPASSRPGTRKDRLFHRFDHIVEENDKESAIFQMLCQILQTDDINSVQAWLVSAGDREKALVLNMIQAVLGSKEEYNNPYTNYKPSEVFLPQPIEGSIIGDEKSDRLKLDEVIESKKTSRIQTANSKRHSPIEEDFQAQSSKDASTNTEKAPHSAPPVLRYTRSHYL